MSIDSLFNARKFTNDARLMSRTALIMSGKQYPYSDREEVIDGAIDFLKTAIDEGSFLIDSSDIEVHNSHFDSLQPIQMSVTVLDNSATFNGLPSEFGVLKSSLSEILSAVSTVRDSGDGDMGDKRFIDAKNFFESLRDCFNALANDEMLEKVVSRASGSTAAHGIA